MQAVVSSLGLHLLVVNASNALQIEDAFAALVQDRVEALQIGVDPLFRQSRRPACGSRRPPQSADHLPVARVHGGRRPHELRIEHSRRFPSSRNLHWTDSERREACGAAGTTPTKLRLVFNLKAAKALGLDVPPPRTRPRRRGD